MTEKIFKISSSYIVAGYAAFSPKPKNKNVSSPWARLLNDAALAEQEERRANAKAKYGNWA